MKRTTGSRRNEAHNVERAVAVGLQLGLCVCEARQNAAVPKTVAQAAETME
jgi:hypothetical protein